MHLRCKSMYVVMSADIFCKSQDREKVCIIIDCLFVLCTCCCHIPKQNLMHHDVCEAPPIATCDNPGADAAMEGKVGTPFCTESVVQGAVNLMQGVGLLFHVKTPACCWYSFNQMPAQAVLVELISRKALSLLLIANNPVDCLLSG